ncbi:MAG: winged helix-turn-helix domain-containing protein [Methanomicrobiaceae archaeon]|nr:winged helix-turn-helix domain-containing protein [Methanomicrobiaceae archaeon]
MGRPFEGILGNTCELRILEFLLPLSGIQFNVTELAEEAGVSRVTAGRVVQKFVSWGILKVHEGRIPLYSIAADSPIVRSVENLNNAIIERMLGEEELREIHEYLQDRGCAAPLPDSAAEIAREARPGFSFGGEMWGAGDFQPGPASIPAPGYATADSERGVQYPRYFR